MAARSPKPHAALAPVAEDAFGGPVQSLALLHQALRSHAQNVRQGTQSTKTRGEVAYSTVKLYRQKGMGRARAGSRGAGHRRGGGAIFGPRPRTIERRLNRRERREALRGALAEKARAQRVHLASSWGDLSKTKERVAWLQATGLHGRVLLVDVEPPHELRRSVGNITDVAVGRAESIGFYDVLVADHIVASEAAFDVLRGETRGQ